MIENFQFESDYGLGFDKMLGDDIPIFVFGGVER
jgi:hypothetical protein